MFAKLSVFAVALPLVSAFTILPLQGTWAPGQSVTIQWQATTSDDPSFSIELLNPSFNKQYAIANNVPTANGQITLELPEVLPGDGYSLAFVANNNDQQVYASSGTFSVGTASSVSATAPSTSATAASTASLGSSASVFTPTFTPASSASSVPTFSSGSSSSASSPSPSTFNNSGAGSFKVAGVAPIAALVLSAVAGAVMVF